MRFLLFSFILLSFVACTDNKTVDLLSQPPYSSITDSIRQFPRDSRLYYRRGELLFGQQELELARKDIRTAFSIEPREDYALSLVTVLEQANKDSAVRFLEDAHRILPGSVAISIGLAKAYQERGRSENAIAITDSVLQRFPGQLDALSLKAELLGGQEKNSESIAFLERAHRLVPSDPALAYDLAYAYATNGNDAVIKLTDSLIKAGTSEIEKAYYTRGLFYQKTGNTNEALAFFDRSIQANYNFLDAWLEKGNLLFDLKRYQQSQANFEKAIKIAPTSAPFYFGLGKALERLGNKTAARESYLQAFALDKTLTDAKASADRLND